MLGVVLHFVKIITNRNHIFEAVVDKIDNPLEVVLRFEAITDDNGTLINLLLFIQPTNEVNIEGRRCFNLCIVIKYLIEYIAEMTAFGTVAIMILA